MSLPSYPEAPLIVADLAPPTLLMNSLDASRFRKRGNLLGTVNRQGGTPSASSAGRICQT